MMIKNRTHFALIAGIGFSLFSGLSHTASTGEDDTALLITNLSAPARLGSLALIHDDEGFFVFETNGKKSRVPNRLVDKSLRGIPQSVLEEFLKNNGRLSVNRNSDGEYSLRVSGGLDGGWGPMDRLAEAIELAAKNLQETGGPAVATVSTAIRAHAAATTKLADAPLAISAAIQVHAAATAKLADALEVSNQLAADNLTSKAKNEKIFQQANRDKIFQQANRDYNTCLDEHPPETSAAGIPSACAGQFNKFKMLTDVMEIREATQPIENEHSAEVHKNPLAEDTAGIPLSACIKRFNQLKMEADTLKVR
jgi:hypothetical protein